MSPDASGSRLVRNTCLIVLALVALRLVAAAVTPLTFDEAYYWIWSNNLASGYYDHPPAVALVIRLGTMIAGDTEFGVRLASILGLQGELMIVTGAGAVAWRLVDGEPEIDLDSVESVMPDHVVSVVPSVAKRIGYAIADRFLREGAAVVITGRDQELGFRAEAALRAHGQAAFVPADAGDPDAVARRARAGFEAALHAKHAWYREPGDVGVEQTHDEPARRQAGRQVDGDGGFAHPALARSDGNNGFDSGKRGGRRGRCRMSHKNRVQGMGQNGTVCQAPGTERRSRLRIKSWLVRTWECGGGALPPRALRGVCRPRRSGASRREFQRPAAALAPGAPRAARPRPAAPRR